MSKLLKKKVDVPVHTPPRRRQVQVQILVPCTVTLTVQRLPSDTKWLIDQVCGVQAQKQGVSSILDLLSEENMKDLQTIADSGKDL